MAQVVHEKNFYSSCVNDHRPKSRNDHDIEYSYILINNKVICLHLPTFHCFLAQMSRRLIGELIVYPCSGVFKHLLLRNNMANQNRILYGASLGRGNECLFAASGLGQMTKMATAPICGKTLQKSSSPESVDRFPRNLVCSIWDSCPS